MTSDTKNNIVLPALKAAFPVTLPILAGFGFIGLAYGIYMNVSGFEWWYPSITSIIIFGGSLEFICVSMLLAPFSPISALMVALMVQARHLFYGISMLDKYKGMGWKKPYLIFALCDESFSLNYTARIPEGVDESWFYFWVSILNQSYWFMGSTIGGLVGGLLKFNTAGMDFVMTTMFVVIFLEQLLKEKQPYTAIIGIGGTLVSLLIFGADSFIIPAMIIILILLGVFKKPIAKAGDMV